jgi:hypothetical protein
MTEADPVPAGGAAARWIGVLVPRLLRALYRSWRVRCEGFEALDAELALGRRVILATWHGRLLTCAAHFGPRYKPAVMISLSRDGDRISAATAPLGVTPVRGSSSRGGARALIEALAWLEQGRVVGHIVDGPRGPAGEIKAGLLVMAQRSGAVLVPAYSASSLHWTAKRSWDRMEVPLPCSRVLYRLGPPRRVPPELGEREIDALRHELEAEMREGYARADADVRNPA